MHERKSEWGVKIKRTSRICTSKPMTGLPGCRPLARAKKEAVANGTEKDKIFAFNTYKSYWKHTKYFIKYIKEKHPECTTLKSAKKYANEWLQTRVDQGLSAWTVQLEAKALGKLYGISPDDENYFNPPKRKREEIKRSRGTGCGTSISPRRTMMN